MSAYTIIALIILVATGGLIAWLGDIIGYRLGKRRSSLFGLRPRTTARMVGIAVGATLPLIGLAVAALGSSYVQDALFNIQHLRDQQQSLSQQVADLHRAATGARSEAEQAQQEAAALKDETQTLHEQAATLRQRITSLQADRDILLAEAERIRSDLQEVKSQLQHSKDELTQVRGENQALQEQRDSLNEEVATLAGNLSSTQGQLEVVNRELAKAMRELEPVREELELKLDRLAELQTELKDVETALADWKQAAYGPVLYESGHELVRDLIRSDQTLEQIRSSLVEDVVLASKVAHASGVVVEEGRSVRVYFAILPESQPAAVGEDQIISGAASAIHGGQEDDYILSIQTVARVFAVRPEPEPAPVMLMVIPNSRVYAEAETIVSVQIDGGRPRDQVFGEVWAILSLLRREAQERGVLAHPETGQYGDVPAEQLLAALDHLLSAGEPQTVRAIAAEDVYRAGLSPFLVAIQVGEESES